MLPCLQALGEEASGLIRAKPVSGRVIYSALLGRQLTVEGSESGMAVSLKVLDLVMTVPDRTGKVLVGSAMVEDYVCCWLAGGC